MGTVLRLLLSALVFAALAWFVDVRALARLAATTSLPFFAASVALILVDTLLATQKWRLLLRGLGLPVAFYPLFRTTSKAFFVSFFVPSALTADLYKGVALGRSLGARKSVASSIVLERLLGLASIVTVGGMAVGWLPARLLGLDGAATLGIAALALGLGLLLFLHADRVADAVLPRLPAGFEAAKRLAAGLAGAFGAYRSRRRLLVETFLLSIAIQFSRSTATWFVARALGDATPFWAFLVLVPYIFMVNLLPFATSRFGLEQGAFVVLFGAVGMPAETALAVSLLSVLSSLIVALPGGFWIVHDRSAVR